MSDGVFVPGKIIITGEHSVVYGKQALAASIGLGVRVRIKEGKGDIQNELLRKARVLAGGNEQIGVDIESELPPGSGLGSSAAVAGAVIKAIREYLGKPIGEDELFQLTLQCEQLAHGNPSGVDPAAVVYRGLIAYRKGQPFERLVLKNPIPLLLVDSGKPEESTKTMVELVAKNPHKDTVIAQIGELTLQIREKLLTGVEVGYLLNNNGLLLEELGVVGERAKQLSRELRKLGCSVKITGAGGITAGSGMMIVISPDLSKTKELLDNKQIGYFETIIGEK